MQRFPPQNKDKSWDGFCSLSFYFKLTRGTEVNRARKKNMQCFKKSTEFWIAAAFWQSALNTRLWNDFSQRNANAD